MDVTIAVLTYNAERWVRDQLKACLAQATSRSVEVLVLDSGSRDRTVAIARELGVRVHEIPNSEFGHGRTRNLAASLSTAEFLVLLTQDAVPATTTWLDTLLAPLAEQRHVAAVFGGQVAPPACRPYVKRTVHETFRDLSPDGAVVVREASERPAQGYFFSNVNSAYRRSVVVDQVPFRDIDYAEDMAFAEDASHQGLATAYVPAAAVVHAHDYALRAHFARAKADAEGSWKTGGGGPSPDLWTTVRNVVSLTRRDTRFALQDKEYEGRTRLRHVLAAPAFSVATALALRHASREEQRRRQ